MNKTRIAVFIISQIIWAFIMWLSGYDFDRRSPDIAVMFCIGILIGALLAGFPFLGEKK